MCRPVLNQYVHTQEEFQSYAKELFELVRNGDLKLAVHKEYDLSTEGIRQAQEDISELPSASGPRLRLAAPFVRERRGDTTG